MKSNYDINERKLDVLAALRKYGILTTPQLATLDGGSKQNVSRILNDLRRDGYLSLPLGQGTTFRDRQAPLIHTLTNRGVELLAKARGIPRGKMDWSQKNGRLQGYYKHRLLTHTVRVRLEAHTKNRSDVSYIEQRDLLPLLGASEITWTVPILDGERTFEDGVTPDYTFRLVFEREPKPHNFATFFLEADRGTEPNEADPERLVYIYRKMLAYYFTYMLGIHTKLFGLRELHVLFVTTSEKRVENMIEVNKRFNNGSGSELFLFTDKPSLCASKDILTHAWLTGRRERVTLTVKNRAPHNYKCDKSN